MNFHTPHLLILPEDEHDQRLANGFAGHINIDRRKIQMLAFANGWHKAQARITEPGSNEIQHLTRFSSAHLLVVLDFDKQSGRLQEIRDKIPPTIAERIYILGTWDEPQTLKKQLGYKLSFEAIGAALLEDCLEPANGNITWQHPVLLHNQAELQRFKSDVCPFLISR